MSDAPSATAVRRSTILVVDDEPAVRDALRALLGRRIPGARVVTAGSAEQASAADVAPDVILSDFRMPGVDGVAFLAEAAERWPGTPRVLITAYADLEVALGAINRAHADHLLNKPLRSDEVVDVVRRLLDERHAEGARQAAFARSFAALRARAEDAARRGV